MVLADNVGVVALVLVVLVALGGWATYTAHVAPETTTERYETASWNTTGSYSHGATVTESNGVYSAGRRLEDQPLYFTAVTPRLDGTFRFDYTATGGGSLNVSLDQRLVVRAVEAGDDGTVEYWRTSEQLGSERATDVPPGVPVRLGFERNVSALFERADRIERQLGGSPGEVEVLVVTQLRLQGTVNGEPVTRTATRTLPVDLGDGTYRVQTATGETPAGRTTASERVPVDHGPLRAVGGPLAVLVGLGALAGLVVGRERDGFVVTDEERTRRAFEAARSEFDEWVTVADLPDEVYDRPRARVHSLDGLVDIAIDTDERVVEDRERDRFVVAGPELTYVYESPRGRPNVDGSRPDEGE
jgi:hypothetical protein